MLSCSTTVLPLARIYHGFGDRMKRRTFRIERRDRSYLDGFVVAPAR